MGVADLVIGGVLYAITLTIFYFFVLSPWRKERAKLDPAQPYPDAVVDDKFIDGVMADKVRGIHDEKVKHVADVLMNWNPGEVEPPRAETYDLLAPKVLALLSRYSDVDMFVPAFEDLLYGRFAKHPADVRGMGTYLTNWYRLS